MTLRKLDLKGYVKNIIYYGRMGSFSSRPRIEAKEYFDESCDIPSGLEYGAFLDWIKNQQAKPLLLQRFYRPAPGRGGAVQDSAPFRVLQWNILAQALGTQADNFVRCPPEALQWNNRKFMIIEELLNHDPDIVCLQEVDHFKFLQRMLDTQGFTGFFIPKPDSPCIYLAENNGPDGCAVFYRRDRFQMVNINTRVLEVWKVQSNQVALLITLRDKITDRELIVLTTHLKARKGALLSSLRYEQGGDLLSFLAKHKSTKPAIVCGDFNAEPSEAVYSRMLESEQGLSSSYAVVNNGEEPSYSTWKIREDGESKHNIDYIFYTPDQLHLDGSVEAPSEGDIGVDRVPSLTYPSDHFSLISDFSFKRSSTKVGINLKCRR